MIDMNEINSEIVRLENSETEWDVMQKLSMLYTVRSGFNADDTILPMSAKWEEGTSGATRIDVEESSSEFLRACDGVDYMSVLAIMDEHLADIRLLYPKVYNTILNRIKSLK